MYKKESKTEPRNYCLISLLPVISKVFEKMIHKQTQMFLNTNRFLLEYQFGFRGNYSTDTCLSHLNNTFLSGFDKGKSTGLVSIDLQKAFDCQDHQILLEKMKLLEFQSSLIDWFDSYLKIDHFLLV